MTSLSHLASLVVFSALVSIVFATLHRDDGPGRLRFGTRLFLGFLLATIVIGRLMNRLGA